jgi:hypothetical protein
MQSDYDGMTVNEKRKFWDEYIRCWRESGLSQRAYCRQYDRWSGRHLSDVQLGTTVKR